MNKNVRTNLSYLVLGLCVGFLFYPLVTDILSEKATDNISTMDMASVHTHAVLEVDTSLPTPVVFVEALKDAKDGYNLHITTENYILTPENVNTEPVQGEGHAHVYVNGLKVARLYGNWFNVPLSEFKGGENLIEVTLNANDHSEWVVNGKHISATTTVLK